MNYRYIQVYNYAREENLGSYPGADWRNFAKNKGRTYKLSTPPTIEILQKTPLLGADGGVLGAYSRLHFYYRILIEYLQIFQNVNSC